MFTDLSAFAYKGTKKLFKCYTMYRHSSSLEWSIVCLWINNPSVKLVWWQKGLVPSRQGTDNCIYILQYLFKMNSSHTNNNKLKTKSNQKTRQDSYMPITIYSSIFMLFIAQGRCGGSWINPGWIGAIWLDVGDTWPSHPYVLDEYPIPDLLCYDVIMFCDFVGRLSTRFSSIEHCGNLHIQ